MNKIALIAKSEYLRRIRSPWFVVATLGVPFLAVAAFALPALAFSDDDEPDRVAVVDQAGLFADLEAAVGDQAVLELADDPLDSLRARVLEGDLEGVLVLPAGIDTARDVRATYYAEAGLGAGSGLRAPVREAVRGARAQAAGADADAVAAFGSAVGVDRVTVRADGDGGDDAFGRFLLANVLALLLYMSILIYGMLVMRGVIEEKANRIVEVIASSVRPFELMMGKVLGIGTVGLTQLAVWVAIMLGISVAAGPLLAAFGPDPAAAGALPPGAPSPADVLSGLLAPDLLLAFVAFFLGGYLLYSSLFAAVGSAVDQESDAQSLQTAVILPLVIPVLFLTVVAESPDGGLALFLSLFPLTSPILMVVRMAVTEVPVWQVLLSLSLLAAAFVGMIALAARIYRVGILMYGKKPSLADLWRWMRTA